MANRLLSVLDSQWIEASADRVLVMSLTNFAGVLEALATRQREFATTCSNSALLQQLDALRLFGVHECDHRYAVLEAAFAQYDVVIKEVGPALGGKKKPKKSSKKRGVHFDAARLDAFNAKIADRQRAVASSRDEFARACDMLADHKLAVLARSVDHVLAAAGSLARDSTALFDNLADAHARIKASVADQQLAVQCATSPLPRTPARRCAPVHTQLGAVGAAAAAEARVRLVSVHGCDLRWIEAEKPFDLAKNVLNLRLCALRPSEVAAAPADADPAATALLSVTPLGAPSFALEIVPHQGVALRMLFADVAERDAWLRALSDAVSDALSESPLVALSERDRELARRASRILRAVPGNRVCADCSAPDPQWVSTTLGAVVCVRCAGVHRQLGGFVSRVRSIALDRWQPELLLAMQELGNSAVNAVFEGAEVQLRASQRATLSLRRTIMLNQKLDFSQLERLDEHHADAAPHAPQSRAAKFKPSPAADIATVKIFIEDKYIRKKYAMPWRQADATPADLSRELFDELGRPSCSLQTCLQLLTHGADPNAHFHSGRTALHQAVILDSVTSIEFLLSHGARVSERDQVGWTPVHYAAHLNHYLSLNLIIRRCEEEDVFAPTLTQETPFDVAQASEATAAMDVLRNDLSRVALLTVNDVITHNHVVVQLTARSEAVRGVSSRRATLNRITSGTSPLAVSSSARRKLQQRPNAPAPAPPEDAPRSPVKTQLRRESSTDSNASGGDLNKSRRRRRSHRKEDGEAATPSAAAASAVAAMTSTTTATTASAATAASGPALATTTDDSSASVASTVTVSDSSGDGAPMSGRDSQYARDTVTLLKNELLNEVDRLQAELDAIRESIPKRDSVAEIAPLYLQLTRLTPEFGEMTQLVPSFEVPPIMENIDGEDVNSLREAVEQNVTNASLLLSQLARSLVGCDFVTLLPLAKVLRNCKAAVLGDAANEFDENDNHDGDADDEDDNLD
jgi:hypothetical protein